MQAQLSLMYLLLLIHCQGKLHLFPVPSDNRSHSSDTPRIVAKIRKDYPDFPIIATGGPTEESIRKTIEAGANAITWTPPSVSELFKDVMTKYRNNVEAPH